MERLNVRLMLLELTRQCNLECRHCFRGESENKYMSVDLIEKVFKNIARVNSILLTGGEPFLAKDQLKKISDILKQDKMNVGDCIIVTNGTILTDEILRILSIINDKANLEIRISNDKFHILELENKGLKEIKEKNVELLKNCFNVSEDFQYDKVYVIDKVGRAKSLTQEDLDYINNIGDTNIKYIFSLLLLRNNE